MVKLVIITKGGSVKDKNVNISNLDDLYKKCGCTNNNNFNNQHVWKYNDSYLSLFGKDDGRANSENKYDLPPPCDNLLLFGNLLVVRHSEEELSINNLLDLPKEDWGSFYEKSFGGFESLEEEDSSEDELENVPEEMKTKDGYLKDGFVIDTNSDDEDYNPNNSEEDSYHSDSSDVSSLNSDDELSEESYLSD